MKPATRLCASCFLLPLLIVGGSNQAAADSCAKSRDYILEGLAGDLPKRAKDYRDLFKACVEALSFANVKDAYILKAGTIAIDPARNTVMATAGTLAQFCQRFPRGSVRFFTPAEQRHERTVGLVVMMPAGNAITCKTVRGET